MSNVKTEDKLCNVIKINPYTTNWSRKMVITKPKLEALKFYLAFNTPTLIGEPEFTEWCSDVNEYVTTIEETSYTKKEYRQLVKGEEVFRYLQNQLGEVNWKLFRDIF